MVPEKKAEDTNNRSNVLEPIECFPNSSHNSSVDLSYPSRLPSKKDLIHGIYQKLVVYLKEVIEYRSSSSFVETKTPAKPVLLVRAFQFF